MDFSMIGSWESNSFLIGLWLSFCCFGKWAACFNLVKVCLIRSKSKLRSALPTLVDFCIDDGFSPLMYRSKTSYSFLNLLISLFFKGVEYLDIRLYNQGSRSIRSCSSSLSIVWIIPYTLFRLSWSTSRLWLFSAQTRCLSISTFYLRLVLSCSLMLYKLSITFTLTVSGILVNRVESRTAASKFSSRVSGFGLSALSASRTSCRYYTSFSSGKRLSRLITVSR